MTILRNSKIRGIAAALAAVAISCSAFALVSQSAGAATLSGVTLTLSNNAASDSTNSVSNTATYTWNFTTASAGTLASLEFTVPTDVTLSSSSTTVYGLAGCSAGSTSLTSGTVTVGLSCSGPTPAGTPVEVAVGTFTNGGVETFTSDVTTLDSTPATIDSGTSESVSFVDNTTPVTVVVPESLTFTNNTTAVTLTPVPGDVSVEGNPQTLEVATNANSGYYVSACAGSMTNDAESTSIAQADPTTPTAALTGSEFGAEAALDTNGANASVVSPWSPGDYLGYEGSCSGSNAEVFHDDEPTNGDVFTLTNAVSVSAVQQAGVYQGTIDYLVTPSY